MNFDINTVGHKMDISIQSSQSSVKERPEGWKIYRSVFGKVESPNFRVRFQYKMDSKPNKDPVESLTFYGSVYLNSSTLLTPDQEDTIARGIKAFVASHLGAEARNMLDDILRHTEVAKAKYPLKLAIAPFKPKPVPEETPEDV